MKPHTQEYFDIACRRIEDETKQKRLFSPEEMQMKQAKLFPPMQAWPGQTGVGGGE